MTLFQPIRNSIIKWLLSFEIGRILLKLGIRVLIPNHRVGVNVVCFDQNNRILMLNHVFHPLSPWGLPGGWMDRNETPDQCGLRELREETGITDATIQQTLAYFRNPGPDHLNIIMLAELNEIQPQVEIDHSEIVDFKWITPEMVPDSITFHTAVGLQRAWQSKGIDFEFPSSKVIPTAF
ncbi:MAG: NUDIX domain-containing protein [Chloroflexota bacterium]